MSNKNKSLNEERLENIIQETLMNEMVGNNRNRKPHSYSDICSCEVCHITSLIKEAIIKDGWVHEDDVVLDEEKMADIVEDEFFKLGGNRTVCLAIAKALSSKAKEIIKGKE